jgi:hypothetical protein
MSNSNSDATYLKQKLSSMSDDELYQMIQFKASEYHEQAISLAKEEVARRKLAPTTNAEELKARIEDQKRQAKEWNKEEGFGTAWLDFYVFVLFASVVINAIFAIFGVILVIWGSEIPIYTPLVLIYTPLVILACIVAGVLAVGLRKRALWAWKLNNGLLILGELALIAGAVIMPSLEQKLGFIIGFFVTLLPSILNYVYFKKRKILFS